MRYYLWKMTREEFTQIARECSTLLVGHSRKTVRERMLEIAESPLAEYRTDFYGVGGYLAELELEIAALLGKEAVVIMPSGTMAQPIALRIWSDRAKNNKTAFHPTCHLHLHEHMGYKELHHLEALLLGKSDSVFTFEDLQALSDKPASLLIELPQREIGGQLPTWDELSAITDEAKAQGIRLHLDGARLWECAPYYGRSYKEIASAFDSVYVSFYKILGGLPGAALAGPADFIAEARIWMRRQGGNLFNMFPTAISAKLGMDHYLPEIPNYVAKAQEVALLFAQIPGVRVVPEVPPTNMMHLHFQYSDADVLDAAAEVAKEHSFLTLNYAAPIPGGSKTELSISSGALAISSETLANLIGEFGQRLTSRELLPDVFITIGIDVGGLRKGFHLVALKGASIVGVYKTRSTEDALAWCLGQGALSVAIDCPCQWRPDTGKRLAEQELYKRGISCYWTPSRSAALEHPKDFYGWIQNGMALYHAISNSYPLISSPASISKPHCFETFPYAVSRQLSGMERDKEMQRRSILTRFGIGQSELVSIDFVDAALCALTAQLTLRGQTLALGDEAGGWIVIPESDTNPVSSS